MKFLDRVQVINDDEKYKKEKVFKGMIGTIIDAEIRDNCFNIIFTNNYKKDGKSVFEAEDDILCPIKIEDLVLIEDKDCSDDRILESLPLHNKQWWCKVENGFILNLNGEKKNKTAYDYNS